MMVADNEPRWGAQPRSDRGPDPRPHRPRPEADTRRGFHTGPHLRVPEGASLVLVTTPSEHAGRCPPPLPDRYRQLCVPSDVGGVPPFTGRATDRYIYTLRTGDDVAACADGHDEQVAPRIEAVFGDITHEQVDAIVTSRERIASGRRRCGWSYPSSGGARSLPNRVGPSDLAIRRRQGDRQRFD